MIVKETKYIGNIYDLMSICWSGALETLKEVERQGKQTELIELLKETFIEEETDLTQLNDFLWFDEDYIYEQLGMKYI